MISITKEFTFDMAHLLENHEGKCKNLHGHTYKLLISVNSIFDDAYDMVVDFSELKEFVNRVIIDKLDHAFAYNKNSKDVVEIGISKLLEENNRKTFAFNFRPTAEKMAKYIFESLNFVCVMESKKFRISEVKLYETPTSYASFKED